MMGTASCQSRGRFPIAFVSRGSRRLEGGLRCGGVRRLDVNQWRSEYPLQHLSKHIFGFQAVLQ